MAGVSQCSLHNAPIFRLLLKVAVNGTHQCESLNFCGAFCPNVKTSAHAPAHERAQHHPARIATLAARGGQALRLKLWRPVARREQGAMLFWCSAGAW